MKYIKLLLIGFLFISLNTRAGINYSTLKSTTKSNFEFGVWITADAKRTDESYSQEFNKYKEAGIDEVLINTNTDPVLLSRLVHMAKKAGLKVHAWIMTMNRPGDAVALQHPDWYMVSRSGKSCYDDRPYVDYYQWLSPSHPEARQHIYDLLEALAKVKGVESVHLDYIRYPDVFLPIALLPKYNLAQNTELPDYDFDYSDASVNAFMKEYGRDPRKREHPEIDMEWKQFRLNQIRNVVNHAYEIAHKYGKTLTAAVFPYPEMADHMVRQRWDKWNIDEVYPMIYHNFYNEGTDWIGFATQQGVTDLKGTKTKVNTGIYIPGVTSEEELRKTILLAKENGAKGVSFFDGNAISDAYLKVIKETKESLK